VLSFIILYDTIDRQSYCREYYVATNYATNYVQGMLPVKDFLRVD